MKKKINAETMKPKAKEAAVKEAEKDGDKVSEVLHVSETAVSPFGLNTIKVRLVMKSGVERAYEFRYDAEGEGKAWSVEPG